MMTNMLQAARCAIVASILATAAPALADTARADRGLDRPLIFQPDAMRASRDLYRELKAVNRAVNALPLTDCKAFAFEKIRRLEARGIVARFVVVRTETGDFHAIAVVGGWALDNRHVDVMTVAQLRAEGYQIAPLG